MICLLFAEIGIILIFKQKSMQNTWVTKMRMSSSQSLMLFTKISSEYKTTRKKNILLQFLKTLYKH